MSYSRGVLMHNFNEDRFGVDLQILSRPPPMAGQSVSHMVHNWKVAGLETNKVEPAAVQGLERHMLFGHTGDMRDPHTNLQKTEFAPASRYFYQDPAKIKDVGTLTADGFCISDDPVNKVEVVPSALAAKRISNWGDMRQSHALPPDERFMTTNKVCFQGQAREGPHEKGIPRVYGEFSRQVDAIQLTRSVGKVRGDNLRSAASLMVR